MKIDPSEYWITQQISALAGSLSPEIARGIHSFVEDVNNLAAEYRSVLIGRDIPRTAISVPCLDRCVEGNRTP